MVSKGEIRDQWRAEPYSTVIYRTLRRSASLPRKKRIVEEWAECAHAFAMNKGAIAKDAESLVLPEEIANRVRLFCSNSNIFVLIFKPHSDDSCAAGKYTVKEKREEMVSDGEIKDQ